MLAGCAPTPKQIEDTTDPIPMYPDYTDIMIPTNIAPLNFLLRNDADAMQVTLKGESKEIQLSFGKKAIFPLNLWESLLEQEVGNRLQITVVARIKGKWFRYPSFYWQVVPEKLDSYISYRLIEPGYEVWNKIQLCEREINTFEERVIADNKDTDGSCMNCHIYGNKKGSLSMFHLRGKQGGTLLNRNGHLRKLKLSNDSLPNGAVYGDFHPSGQFAVFSTNIIIPAFHSLGNKRLEVYDTTSDLMVADFRKKQLITSPLTSRKDELETFPTFSPDGNWIYYCSAPLQPLPDSIHNLKYSLCRISFHKDTKEWGQRIETVWELAVIVSPDGSTPASLLQDTWFSIGKVEAGKKLGYHMHQSHAGVYIFLIEGEIVVDGEVLKRRDGMGVYDTNSVELETLKDSHILLIEVPM